MSDNKGSLGLYIYLVLNAIFFLFVAIYCQDWTSNASDNSTYPTGFMNQIAGDWNSTMLNDLSVVMDDYCPDDYPEITYSRRFYGAGIACDCLGIYSQWITGQNRMNLNEVCSYNQTRYGCLQSRPISPIRQSNINGVMICGQGNAGHYVNVTRPVSGVCPSGTQLCSQFTNSTNSICATSLDKCPITDVKFVLNADVSKYNTDASVTTEPYYKSLTYTTTVTLLYSQQVDSMPITTFQVGIQPCMAPGVQEGKYFYPTELNDFTQCPVEVNSGLRYDPMYTQQSTSAF